MEEELNVAHSKPRIMHNAMTCPFRSEFSEGLHDEAEAICIENHRRYVDHR